MTNCQIKRAMNPPVNTEPFGTMSHQRGIRAAITLRQVLALPSVQRAIPEVLAGADSLDREIRWVHSAEVANIASLLKGQELLLTTGMGIGRSPAEQRRFVAELAERGVAALALELGTTMAEVPPALTTAAERQGLCLIAFHREVRFVEITEAVHREIVDQGGELLRRGEALHRRFTDLLLQGATVPDVLTELSRFVANPVVLERSGHGVAYHARHQADDATVLARLGLVRARPGGAGGDRGAGADGRGRQLGPAGRARGRLRARRAGPDRGRARGRPDRPGADARPRGGRPRLA